MRLTAAYAFRDRLLDGLGGAQGIFLPIGVARLILLSAVAAPVAVVACDSSALRSGPGELYT